MTRYDTDGKEWTTSDYPMLAWLENENTVRLILDAADLSAATYYYNELYGSYQDNPKTTPILDNLKNTYSFHRFCVDTENILCKVKGVGKDYKPTAVRKSNVSHTYFGEYTKKAAVGLKRSHIHLKMHDIFITYAMWRILLLKSCEWCSGQGVHLSACREHKLAEIY